LEVPVPNASLPENLPADFAAAFAHLTACEKLSVDDMKLMILLETAGEPLYMRMAELAPNEQAAELLRKNGREETAHAHRLKRAIEIVTGEPYEIPAMSENPYAEPPALPPLSREMLEGVVGADNGGDAMYQSYAAHESNPEVAELLRQNGREETRHGERVAQVIELLEA
jgi:rubrerythrin